MGFEPMAYGLKVRCSTRLSYNPYVENIVSFTVKHVVSTGGRNRQNRVKLLF